MRRASIMSVIAPAGSVKRNIGSVVATWTADTIMGSGLRLVMSQFDEVSNIANPTFDAELAISMTVNAKLPKTPQSRTAAASDLAVDSLDNKIPIGRARNWVAATCPIFRSNGEQRGEFQGAAVRKVTATDECGCSKSELQDIHTHPFVPAAASSASAQNSFSGVLSRGYCSRRSAPPRTRQISRACDACRNRIPLDVVERKNLFWPACYGARK